MSYPVFTLVSGGARIQMFRQVAPDDGYFQSFAILLTDSDLDPLPNVSSW